MTTYQVTNKELFDSKVSRVYIDLAVFNDGFKGDITIVETSGENNYGSGEHGPSDFEEEYGFILVSE